MANRLEDETSPYLRQHADNPVDWWPWCDEAFELARSTDRPVLLSVGYSSCHWCHVMAHESFEDPAVARLMNDWFIPVKVDREERPDVDAIYMEATQSMTGHGGWPMTVFTDPDGRPFFCGTYFPPEPRHGQAGFTQLLQAVHEAWTDRRDGLMDQAERLTEALRRPVGPQGDSDSALPGATLPDEAVPDVTVLDEATMGLLSAFDGEWGGFGRAPKFPQSMSLDHLLRHHHRTGSATALAAVVTSLDAMAAGGIHDQIGGGFSRYSVDRQWLVPHFEKMLYDNALLIRTYSRAYQVTGESRFREVAVSTVRYLLRDLSHPDGGRYSAEDADSLPVDAGSDVSEPGSHRPVPHPEEGAFYTWTPHQVAVALTEAGLSERADEVCEWYGISENGNFEGASIPNRLHARTAQALGPSDRAHGIEASRLALLEARSRRPRPGLDDKVLTEWNALFVSAAAEAGCATGVSEWIDEAERTAEFLIRSLRRDDGRWLRSWQADGGARHLAYAADHGALLDAFLRLYEATGRRRWLDEATTVAGALRDLFVDDDGTVFSTGVDAEQLLIRPREVMDNATPSGASLAAVGFLRLAAVTGDGTWSALAGPIIRSLGTVIGRHPLGFGHLLWAVHLDSLGITEVVVSGDRPDLVEVAHRIFTPTAVVVWGEPDDGPLWEGRTEAGAGGRAYVCRDRTCEAPITDPTDLADALRTRVTGLR